MDIRIYNKENSQKIRLSSKKLAQQLRIHVGTAFGYSGEIIGEPEYFLIIYSDDKSITFPPTFEGLKVVRREVPIIL